MSDDKTPAIPPQVDRFVITLASDGTIRDKSVEPSRHFRGVKMRVAHGHDIDDFRTNAWFVRVSSCQSFDHAEAIARDFIDFAQRHGIGVFA